MAEVAKRELPALNHGCMGSHDSKQWREDATRHNSTNKASLLLISIVRSLVQELSHVDALRSYLCLSSEPCIIIITLLYFT